MCINVVEEHPPLIFEVKNASVGEISPRIKWQNTDSVWIHGHEELLHTQRGLQGRVDRLWLQLCMKQHWLWSFPVTKSQRQPHQHRDISQCVDGYSQLAKLYRKAALWLPPHAQILFLYSWISHSFTFTCFIMTQVFTIVPWTSLDLIYIHIVCAFNYDLQLLHTEETYFGKILSS